MVFWSNMPARLFSLIFSALLTCANNGLAGVLAANEIVLEAVEDMPEGGGYSVGKGARAALERAVNKIGLSGGEGEIEAFPSFCSGATYLVLLKSILELERRGFLGMDDQSRANLFDISKKEGEGAWGRWNSNGPGAGVFLNEAGIGRNFISMDQARPGDFAKLHWTSKVGKGERGHLVVFLGFESVDGVPSMRFWSANNPGGKGEKTVPLSEIKHAIFSRLVVSSEGSEIRVPDDIDGYLASILKRSGSWDEVLRESQASR